MVTSHVDLSRQDLPRIGMFRIGERRDLFGLTFLHAIFVSRAIQWPTLVTNQVNRWIYRFTVFVLVIYVLGGDGSVDFVTRVTTLVGVEFFLFCRITFSNRQKYRQDVLINDYL